MKLPHPLRGRLRDTGTLIGATEESVDRAEVEASLDAQGEVGARVRHLDRLIEEEIGGLGGQTPLSDLSGDLAMSYLDRISRPLSRIQTPEAVWIITRGYEAHRVMERRGAEFGVVELPVLSALPDLDRREALRDIQLKLVRSTGRGFQALCSLDPRVLDGLGALTMVAVHEQVAVRDADSETGAVYVSPDVVQGLLRYGWVLRQVDLHYGQADTQG